MVVLGLLAAAGVGAVTVGENLAVERDRTRYGIRIALLPSPDLNDVFACKVQVRDLATDEIVSQPMLLARWGETAEIEQADHVQQRVVSVRAVVDETGHTAEYSVEVAERGVPVARQDAIVELSERSLR